MYMISTDQMLHFMAVEDGVVFLKGQLSAGWNVRFLKKTSRNLFSIRLLRFFGSQFFDKQGQSIT